MTKIAEPSTLALPLVIAQFSLIATMVMSRPGAVDSWLQLPGLLFILAAIVLAVWALLAMRLDTFSVMPIPVKKGTLCQRGPYAMIRHPMYSAVGLASLGLCLMQTDLLPWLITLALCCVLVVKLHIEEILLTEKYPAYTAYQSTTSRLLPGLF